MESKQLEYLLYRIDGLEKRIKDLENRFSLEQYFTVQEIANSLSLNPVTIVRKIKDGEIKAIKIGKEYRISKQEVEVYILGLGS